MLPVMVSTPSYNPTLSEVACMFSTATVAVTAADVQRNANPLGLRNGRLYRHDVTTVGYLAAQDARERMLRERETRAILREAWEGIAARAIKGAESDA